MKQKFADIFFVFCFFFMLNILLTCSRSKSNNQKINFNAEWKFYRGELDTKTVFDEKFDDHNWETIHLPHAPSLTPMRHPWPLKDNQGINWYRKEFQLAEGYKGKKIFIEFEGADQVADVWINGDKMWIDKEVNYA